VKLTRPSGLTLLAGALLLLMPALAVLQFRWVGQVSDAEHERMQRNLDVAATQFRRDFEGELFGLQNLSVTAGTAREQQWDRYAQRYEEWSNITTHPGIVKNIYLVDSDGRQLGLRRWNTEEHVFELETGDWPASLEPWHGDFQAEFVDFNEGTSPDRTARFRDPDDQGSLLVYQLRFNPVVLPAPIGPTTPGSRPQRSVTVFGFTVVELDMAYIRQQLLPELAGRHFSHPSGDSYRIAVVDWDDPSKIIYRTDSDAPTDAAHADSATGLFARFGTLRQGRPPGQNDERPGALTGGRPGPPGQLDARTAVAGRAGGPDPARNQPARWRLMVQHQSGSLEAAVNGARTRNLALSFGVLLLLTFTIGLLTVTSRRAQQVAKQQMEFVAGVSHELRTPVAVIKSAAENLSQGVVGNPDRVKRYGKMIETEARRLGEMVERVLQYAGIESGLGYGARSPLSPSEVIESAVDSALPLLGPDAINIQRDIPEDLPAVVGDAAALRSVVQNLFMNAVKYGGTDRWVGIKAEHARDGRSHRVRITVSDHGAGIPANDLPHIFDPFYRGDDAMSRQIHGNGLGLSLVNRIVRAHGGTVSVRSREHEGTTFTITLPAEPMDPRPTAVHGDAPAAAH